MLSAGHMGSTLVVVVSLYTSSNSSQNLFRLILHVVVIFRGSLGLKSFLGFLSVVLLNSWCLSKHIFGANSISFAHNLVWLSTGWAQKLSLL